MNTTLRNTVISALGLLLVAAPALADGGSAERRAEIAKLQVALDEVEASMDAVSQQISDARDTLAKYRSQLAETGDPTFKKLIGQTVMQINQLQSQHDELSAQASELRAQIEWLNAQDRADEGTP